MIAPTKLPWVILTSRYGADTPNPSADKLAEALAEVFHEDHPAMTEEDYAEHPSAWLRHGFDDGPMYVLGVYRGGRAVFSQWADQDYETALAPESEKNMVGEQEALRLWTLLAMGNIDQLRSEAWDAI